MQIAVHILAYDVDLYINAMLQNVGPWVDKIYIAYPPRPWDYIPSSRDTRTNPTRLESIDAGEFSHKVEIIKGDWKKEEDTRNACLERAMQDGMDWLIIQDADEFYTEQSWKILRHQLQNKPNVDLFVTTWYNFWKSSYYVIENNYGSIKSENAGFAVRCKPELKFVRARSANSKSTVIIDEPCYHYGYVKSDEEMLAKVTQWGHAHQFDGPRWIRLKWLRWNLWTENIHPVTPPRWRRAVLFPLHQPEFAHQFAIPVEAQRPKPFPLRAQEMIYDGRANATFRLRAFLTDKG